MDIAAGTMTVVRFFVLALATGCSFDPLPGDTSKDGSIDTPPDSTPGVDGTPTMPCFGPAGWEVCLPAIPTNTETIAGTLVTTDDPKCADPLPSSWAAAGQPDACIIIAERIDVTGSEVVVSGSRPLVLVASDMITIAGILDVGSHRDPTNFGPGAPSADCTTGKSPETEAAGGGGGAGGTFMTKGGDGGNGDDDDEDAEPGKAGDPITLPTKLRAGCRGQTGAQGGGTSGQGGGAVYLLAGVSITGGRIDASGAGATEGGPRSGGSGGGSGGMVVLYAPAISIVSINANGGGGASGANTPNSGDSGDDADVTTPTTAAAGGSGAGGGGGDGFAGGSNAQSGSAGIQTVGGGGGGGGAGSIRANVQPSNSLSPGYTGV
jgi:hypothetical protein